MGAKWAEWKEKIARLESGKYASAVQFLKFCMVGVSNTAVNYAINAGTLKLLEPLGWKYDYVAANTVAFVLSVLWSFYWNNRYVFREPEGQKRDMWKTLLKTYVAYGFTGIILNNVLSWLWIDVLGISKYIAPLINLIFSIPINYLINKNWAYRVRN